MVDKLIIRDYLARYYQEISVKRYGSYLLWYDSSFWGTKQRNFPATAANHALAGNRPGQFACLMLGMYYPPEDSFTKVHRQSESSATTGNVLPITQVSKP